MRQQHSARECSVSRLWDRLLPVAWPTRLTAVWPWVKVPANPASSWGEYERRRDAE
jgi:hypothetical protein